MLFKKACLSVAVSLLAASFVGFPTSIQSQPDQKAYAVKAKPIRFDSMERVYVHSPSGDENALLALRDELRDAGAQRVNVFLPSVLVCEVPLGTDYRAAAERRGLTARAEMEVREEIRFTGMPTPGWTKHCYRTTQESMLHPATDYAPPKDHLVLRAPAEEVVRVGSGGHNAVTAAVQDERTMVQNTEFMVGSILVRVVMPESGGNQENWTGGDIVSVQSGVAQALIYWQEEFRGADINFVIEYETYVAVADEPILLDPSEDRRWITDAMEELGYTGGASGEYLNTVNNYNNDGREARGTDWVFTVFVIKAQNTTAFPTYRDIGYSYLGGPALVTPYPGSGLFQPSFRHEMGHVFWAFDEEEGPSGACSDFSGYLNYKNHNKTIGYDPIFGSPQGCTQGVWPDACIMHTGDAYSGYIGPPCFYTEGMMGAVDEFPQNNVPDVFDAPPAIEFFGAGVETVVTADSGFQFKAVSRAVGNRNPQQAGNKRSYAPPIKDVSFSIDGSMAILLNPIDGESDEVEEEFEIEIPFLRPGTNDLTITARNVFGARSNPTTKRLFYLSLDYFGFSFQFDNAGVKMTWAMRGLTFNAKYDMHRVTTVDGEELDEIIGTDLVAAAAPYNSLTPYRFVDEDVVPGNNYTYYIKGSFTIPYRGDMTEFTSNSRLFTTVASFPVTSGVLSQPAPNPFSDHTWISVLVPATFDDGQSLTAGPQGVQQAPGRKQTPVTVIVYDVAGRKVKDLARRFMFDTALTISWDGTNNNNEKVPSGMYFIKAASGELTDVKKVMILR